MAGTHLCYGDGRGPRVCQDGPEAECAVCAARAKQWQQAPKDAKALVLEKLRALTDVEPIADGMTESEIAAAVSRTIGRLAGQQFAPRVDVQAKMDAWRRTGVWPLPCPLCGVETLPDGSSHACVDGLTTALRQPEPPHA